MLDQALATLKVEPESITLGALGGAGRGNTARRASSRCWPTSGWASGCRSSSRRRWRDRRARPTRRRRGAAAAPAKPAALTLRGVEGVAIQYAKCCRPVPGDARRRRSSAAGRVLPVHTRDCVTLKKQRGRRRTADRRRVGDRRRGRVRRRHPRCWSPTAAGCLPTSPRRSPTPTRNIDNVSMERPDGGGSSRCSSACRCATARHLAHVMRALKRVPEVRARAARADLSARRRRGQPAVLGCSSGCSSPA